MEAFLILVVIVLGWIVFEQYSSKKQQNEHTQKFKDVELKRDEKFKKSPAFLNNVIKTNSIFKRLTTFKIEKIEIDYFCEFEDKVYEIEKEIYLFYSEIPFYIRMLGSEHSCTFHLSARKSKSSIQGVNYDHSENDDVTIEKILSKMEKIVTEIKD